MTPRPRWSRDDVRALPAATTVEIAGEVLGLSRTAAYEAVNRGTFPVSVVKVTRRRWIVPTAALLRLLELDGATDATGEERG